MGRRLKGVVVCGRNKLPTPRRRRLARWALGLAALAVGAYLFVVETEVKPRLEELAEYECRAIVVQAMNEAVNAEMQRTPERYEELYTLALMGRDGTLTAVQADAGALNAARAAWWRLCSRRWPRCRSGMALPAGQPERLDQPGRAGAGVDAAAAAARLCGGLDGGGRRGAGREPTHATA